MASALGAAVEAFPHAGLSPAAGSTIVTESPGACQRQRQRSAVQPSAGNEQRSYPFSCAAN